MNPEQQRRLIRCRPYLYHYAPRANLTFLRALRRMESTAALVARAEAHQAGQVPGVSAFLRTPRPRAVTLTVAPCVSVCLNDQQPLTCARIAALEAGHSFEDYVCLLNGFVFFWPGNAARPKPRGRLSASFSTKYAGYSLIRLDVASVLAANPRAPLFCKYNSGAPQARDRVTRGPSLFTRAFDSVCDIAEVVFPGHVQLPNGSAEERRGQVWAPL